MLRFVILQHQMPPDSGRSSHWDLMFEVGDVLRTWAIEEPLEREGTFAAFSLPDHRLAYLGYEGPISGGRGHVTRWDQGAYELLEQGEGLWLAKIAGLKVRGLLRLEQLPVPCEASGVTTCQPGATGRSPASARSVEQSETPQKPSAVASERTEATSYRWRLFFTAG